MQLRSIRIGKDLSVPSLSKLSDVPVRTIENIERTGNCQVATAIKLSKALNVTLDELCKEKNQEF